MKPIVWLLIALSLALLASLPVMAQDPCHQPPRNLIRFGERFLAMGRVDAAIARFSSVIDCHPGTSYAAEAHSDRGVAYARQGDLDKAMGEYEAALAINEYPLARFNMGKACMEVFQASGDQDMRDRALREFRLFSDYLRNGSNFPDVIGFQKDEIVEYVREAIESLEY
ncbi:tetratricopeptide repeat protein [Desulfonatronum thiodismutans]|uniref:tetratricopeptide repeat protein n=1 Tax=Desulfonatronum thiodismutans TaxID=159290 RepID=UPI0004ABE041|nr:tetratricopeptide repeat protein [Desulfonatronum thiodismutans]